MTVISFAQSGNAFKVKAEGHSGYNESGNDIVCAAVSTLVQTAYLALEDIGCDVKYVRDADKALFAFEARANKDNRHDVEVIIRMLKVGIRDLQSGYPQYIKSEE